MNHRKEPDEERPGLTRRQALGAAGAGLLLAGAGTGLGGIFDGGDDEAVARQARTCLRLMAEQEEGPFYVDLEKVRADTVEGQAGVPLDLRIRVIDHTRCVPIVGAACDIWQCNAYGVYSDEESEQTVGETFLRGVQFTDSEGWAEFKTIYPGHYAGRATHVHVKVHLGGRPLISRSEDLRKLRDEGLEVGVQAGHLVVDHIPYLDSERKVRFGRLVSTLTLSGEVTMRPDTHVVTFSADMPCDIGGAPLERILIGSNRQELGEGLVVDFTFSSKPPEGYVDYHEKMWAYIRIISGPAQAVDDEARAETFRVVETDDADSVFEYLDTASSRAGIGAITAKLEVGRVAIVGLGGTGSYILDLLAKTPIAEIHLFDRDLYLQHNAFRSPGASSVEELRQATTSKVAYLSERYGRMRRGIIPHEVLVDASNVAELSEMDFVFVAIDDGSSRRLIVEELEASATSFIDVGMGVFETGGSLGGLVRTSASTPDRRARHFYGTHPVRRSRGRERIRTKHPDRGPERAERRVGGDQVQEALRLLPRPRARAFLRL